jgi:hypothetical protein
MVVKLVQHFAPPRGARLRICAALFLAGAGAWAQGSNPSSAANPYFGSVTAQPVTDETLKLSLDDAVRRGFENNLGLKEAENSEKALHGEKNQALQEFLHTITVKAETGYCTIWRRRGSGRACSRKLAGSFRAARYRGFR